MFLVSTVSSFHTKSASRTESQSHRFMLSKSFTWLDSDATIEPQIHPWNITLTWIYTRLYGSQYQVRFNGYALRFTLASAISQSNEKLFSIVASSEYSHFVGITIASPNMFCALSKAIKTGCKVHILSFDNIVCFVPWIYHHSTSTLQTLSSNP